MAFGHGIPSIGFVDNETATAQNKLMLPLTSRIIYPEPIDKYDLMRSGADANALKPIKGFAELAHIYGFIPSKEPLNELGLEGYDYIVMRPEPIKANYFNGDAERSVLEKIIPMLPDIPIVLFPRTESQRKRFERFYNVIMPEKPMDSLSLLYYAKMMIGAGGTMNREAIALGTPTISTYPGRILAVTKWMANLGVKFHSTDPLAVARKAYEFLRRNDKFRSYIRYTVSRLENPIDAILREIEMYEEYGSFEEIKEGETKLAF